MLVHDFQIKQASTFILIYFKQNYFAFERQLLGLSLYSVSHFELISHKQQPTVKPAICASLKSQLKTQVGLTCEVFARAVHCLASDPSAQHNETQANAFRKEPPLPRSIVDCISNQQTAFRLAQTKQLNCTNKPS